MLRSLDELSGVATRTVNASQEDLVADLEALEPSLRQLANTGAELPDAIGFLATYPFPEYAMKALKGDFMNAWRALWELLWLLMTPERREEWLAAQKGEHAPAMAVTEIPWHNSDWGDIAPYWGY